MDIGLVNGVTSEGKAKTEAITLALSLCKLPQNCMGSDCRSAYGQWSMEMEKALHNETTLGIEVINNGETKNDAIRFANGDF